MIKLLFVYQQNNLMRSVSYLYIREKIYVKLIQYKSAAWNGIRHRHDVFLKISDCVKKKNLIWFHSMQG